MATLEKKDSPSSLAKKDIGQVTNRAAKPMFFDLYEQNKHFGSLIIVDQATNNTVAAGMVRLRFKN